MIYRSPGLYEYGHVVDEAVPERRSCADLRFSACALAREGDALFEASCVNRSVRAALFWPPQDGTLTVYCPTGNSTSSAPSPRHDLLARARARVGRDDLRTACAQLLLAVTRARRCARADLLLLQAFEYFLVERDADVHEP